jgi:integrase
MSEGRKYNRNRQSWGATRKLPSGRWQASYLVGDVRYTAPMTYTSKADAEGFLARTRVAVETGGWKDPKAIIAETFGTYATTWVSQRVTGKGQPLRPRTRAEYVRILDKGLSTFSRDRLDAITPARVRAWHAKRTKDAGATSAAKETQLLRAILNTAVVDEILTRNPVPVELTRSRTGKEHRPPTPDELAILLDEIHPLFRFAVVLAAVGGLRIGEWKCLRRKDFSQRDDGRYVVGVSRQVQWVPGTGWVVGQPKSAAGLRSITLPDSITIEVERHLAEFTGAFPDALLWQPPRAAEGFIHDSYWRDSWNVARDSAGVRHVVREHDLRHYALTAVAVGGGTLAEVMAVAGHSTPAAAMVYQHAAADRLAEVTNKVAPLPQRKPSNVIPITG